MGQGLAKIVREFEKRCLKRLELLPIVTHSPTRELYREETKANVEKRDNGQINQKTQPLR